MACSTTARPAFGDLGEPAPAVGRVGPADHHLLPLQPVDDVRDAGGVHHQPLADQSEGQRTAAAEGEQDQRLVAGERQPVRPQQRVELAEQDLLRPHDRGDRGHRRRGTEPARPDLRRPVDRVKRQFKRLTHGYTVCGALPIYGTPGPESSSSAAVKGSRVAHC